MIGLLAPLVGLALAIAIWHRGEEGYEPLTLVFAAQLAVAVAAYADAPTLTRLFLLAALSALTARAYALLWLGNAPWWLLLAWMAYADWIAWQERLSPVWAELLLAPRAVALATGIACLAAGRWRPRFAHVVALVMLLGDGAGLAWEAFAPGYLHYQGAAQGAFLIVIQALWISRGAGSENR